MTRRSRVRMDGGSATCPGATDSASRDRPQAVLRAQPRVPRSRRKERDEVEVVCSASERENAPANANMREQRQTRTRTSCGRVDSDAGSLQRENAEPRTGCGSSSQSSKRDDADLAFEAEFEADARVENETPGSGAVGDDTTKKVGVLRVDSFEPVPLKSGHSGLRRGTKDGEGPFLGVKLPTYGKRRRARAARASIALLCTRKSSSPDSVNNRLDDEEGATESLEQRDAKNAHAILHQDPGEALMWKNQREFWDCVDNVVLEEELDDDDLKGLLQ
jgi:hypothetical protein